jgi:hypothetical protein
MLSRRRTHCPNSGSSFLEGVAMGFIGAMLGAVGQRSIVLTCKISASARPF